MPKSKKHRKKKHTPSLHSSPAQARSKLPTSKQPNPITFLKEVRTELAKVQWPTRQETIKLTFVVIGVSVAMSLFIAGIDIILVKLTEVFLR